MLETVAVALVLGYFMLVWLRTDAFAEYLTLFRLSNHLHIKDYNALRKEGYGGNYVSFMVEYYQDSFIVRLVSCPVCLSFWLGLTSTLYKGDLSYILVAPLSLFFYLLFNRLF